MSYPYHLALPLILLGFICSLAAVEEAAGSAAESVTGLPVELSDEQLTSLRAGIVSGELPDGLWLTDALDRYQTATVGRPAVRAALADAVVAAIVEDGIDRHDFLDHVPYLQEFAAHAQLTTLLLHDPGEDDYWLDCCFYISVYDALADCGTPADAERLRAEAPERDRQVFLDLADELDGAASAASVASVADDDAGADPATEPDKR